MADLPDYLQGMNYKRDRRLAEVRRRLAKYQPVTEIVEELSEAENVTQRTVYKWIDAVRDRWRREANLMESTKMRDQAIQAAQTFLQECLKDGSDSRAQALGCLKWLGDLHGLTADVKQDGKQITVKFNLPGDADPSDEGDQIMPPENAE